MSKKFNLVKAAAITFAFTASVAGITFMAVSDNRKIIQAQETAQADYYTSPSAGLSTEILLATIEDDSISTDFLSVSSVAQERAAEQEEIVAAIEALAEETYSYYLLAVENSGGYSAADEYVEKALAAYEDAQYALECARNADTSVLAQMYVQDAAETVQAAQKAADEALDAAEIAAEEEAERLAAEAAAAHEAEVAALRQEIVSYACSFAGWLPYVHGGSSLTSGVDCSGFTAAIYAHFGYTLSHSSSVQSTQGRSVSLSEIEPGDIVVYSGHVALYIGNGQIVHAPGTGRTVTIASMYIMTILDVRRIVE